MTLTFGTGPFAAARIGWADPPLPDRGIVYVEPHRRRIQATLGEVTVIDTERALLVHRPGSTLSYAFPADAVCDLACAPVVEAPGYVTVAWDAVDAWSEEGRRLVRYPPNPYHRVDCRPTTRRLLVTVDAATLVDTEDTTVVFETSLTPVLYVDRAHVRMDLLRPSDTTSWCNYKGTASYWHAAIDGNIVNDVAWSYVDPLPESTPIAGFLAFDAGADPTRITVDSQLPPAG